MSRTTENTPFQCQRCGADVQPSTDGSYRNHCPFCLYSLHVDREPGDRSSGCGGLMQPVGLCREGRRPQIVHRCSRCGRIKVNRVVDIGRQPDSVDVLVTLSPDDAGRSRPRSSPWPPGSRARYG